MAGKDIRQGAEMAGKDIRQGAEMAGKDMGVKEIRGKGHASKAEAAP
jgi:hypothetical protein